MTRAKNIFRWMAVLIGLAGILNLSIAVSFNAKFKIFEAILGCLFGLLGLYLLYVAYLCWWRLSPRMVRHVCAVGAFYLLGGAGLVLDRLEPFASQGVLNVLGLAASIGIVWAYFPASRFVTRLVFREQGTQIGSP